MAMPQHLAAEAGAMTALRHLRKAASEAHSRDTLQSIIDRALDLLLAEIQESAEAEKSR